MCTDWTSNPQPLVYRVTLQPTEPPSRGPPWILTLPQRDAGHQAVRCPAERGTWQGPEDDIWLVASKKVNPISSRAHELGSRPPPGQPWMKPQPQCWRDLGQVGGTAGDR